jgi:hypothetical protein
VVIRDVVVLWTAVESSVCESCTTRVRRSLAKKYKSMEAGKKSFPLLVCDKRSPFVACLLPYSASQTVRTSAN